MALVYSSKIRLHPRRDQRIFSLVYVEVVVVAALRNVWGGWAPMDVLDLVSMLRTWIWIECVCMPETQAESLEILRRLPIPNHRKMLEQL